MLGRDPRSTEELLMVYAGIMAPQHQCDGGRMRPYDSE